MTRTYLSISEKTDPRRHRSLYILHNGCEWYHADTNIKEHMMEEANGRRLKSFLGLSNGSIVTCYAAFDDDKNTVEILRPNPNAEAVYQPMPLSAELEYRKNHWYL